MSFGFDAGALMFKIQTAGYATFEQQMDAADRKVQGVGKSAADAAPKVEKAGTAVEQTGKKAKDATPALDSQSKSTRKVGDESEDAAKKQKKQAASAEEQAAAARKLATALTLTGIAVAAVVGLSVAKWTEFDRAMSNTSAAVMATTREHKELSEAALEAGADTAYSASEAAAAQEELAKAGMTVAEIIGGSLNGALALAAAGQLQVARSAEIMATTLKQYKLPAEEAAHVSDVLAAGAGKAQGSVDDLALALTYVGPLANQAGWSIEETGGALAYFASQGILGEKAGTSLRGVLAALQSPSSIAKKTMDEYGLSVYDASGKMLSASEMSQRLQSAFAGLTDEERNAALGRIFGNESLTAATLLYTGGAAAIDEWTEAVNDTGYAAEQARMRQDNLAGDIEKLGGAFDTALIRTGSGANDVLREMVQSVTALVDWYGELPAPVQQAALVIGVAAGAAMLFAGAAVGLRSKFIELKVELDKTNVSFGKTAIVGAGASIALTGVVTVLAIFAQRQAEATARVESFQQTLDATTGAATKSTRDLVIAGLQAEQSFLWMGRGSTFDAAERLGISVDTVTNAALNQADALAELSLYLKAADGDETALQQVMNRTGLSRLEAIDQLDVLVGGLRTQGAAIDEATRKQEQSNKVTGEGADVTRSAADAYLEAATNASDLDDKLRSLIDTIFAQNDANLDAREAQRQWVEALEKFDAAVAENGATLDLNTAAGRENQESLDNIAERAMKVAEATTAAGGSYEGFRASLESSRQALMDRIAALGYAGDEAAAMADEILRIPSQTEWTAVAETTAARSAIAQFVADASAKTITIGVTTYSKTGDGLSVQVEGSRYAAHANGAVVSYHANGSVSENHVAQIAGAGEYRVWAEDETGGEGYVPLAPSKRPRSEQIMMEIADRFGGTYIPGGAPAFADGSSGTATYASLEGLRITGRLDLGDGLIGMIDGRIGKAEKSQRQTDARGYQGGF